MIYENATVHSITDQDLKSRRVFRGLLDISWFYCMPQFASSNLRSNYASTALGVAIDRVAVELKVSKYTSTPNLLVDKWACVPIHSPSSLGDTACVPNAPPANSHLSS